MTELAALPALAKGPDLRTVIVVETIRAAHPGAPITSDYRVSIASFIRSAPVFVAMSRQHWHIEHKLPWSLDVTVNEDSCRLCNDFAPDDIVAARHIALDLLRHEHSHQLLLRQKRLLCDLDEHYLLTVRSRAT